MEEYLLEELTGLEKRQFLALTELVGLTEELAQAVDRKDQISVKMVLSMRQEPCQRLQETDTAIREKLLKAPEDEAIRLSALLNGQPAESPREEALCQQVVQNSRLLKKITELDRQVSLRLGGKRSFYKKYREAETDGK